MTEAAVYTCSICNEPSTDICVQCTKDACRNHRCERCKACSDCCECEVPLTAAEPEPVPAVIETLVAPEPESPTSDVEPVELPAPPQASEEPDLNIPAAPRFEEPNEPSVTDQPGTPPVP